MAMDFSKLKDPDFLFAMANTFGQMSRVPLGNVTDVGSAFQQYDEKQKQAQAKATENKTLAWLQQNDPEAYQYAQAGLPVNDAFKYAVDKRQKAQQTPTAEVVKGDNNSFYTYDPKNPQGTFKALQGPVEDPKEAEKQRLEAAKLEADTNKMYRGEDPVKQYEGVKFGYEKLRSAATQDTGPADISMVFGFMKMLDPTSVVREGEAANIQNTSGVPDKVRIMYNQALSGVKLSPQQRAEILQTADAVYQEASTNLQDRNKYYQDYSTRAGINPGYVMQPETFPKLELNGPAAEIKTSTGPVKLRRTGE